jgi:HEPN domain-containing protein
MTQEEAVRQWKEGAERNIDLARDMMKLEHYDWALFFGQLVLEKLLKGLYLSKNDELAPFTHDLIKLAKLSKLSLTKQQTEELIEITRFHIQARYDDVKYEFYKKATKQYSQSWLKKIEEYMVWILKQY